ncbi:DJ-1/PfpI family protein [Paenibacillus sp. NEAU-GSW1]|uniref:DJ-1/PfpI family protein n=1 Tax=Paenibacillus sp. NEAU-GSW1 TaxID=2682486 RepID=UPI0012E1E2D6|nr:DJ-1/PfpI family protein [Paenibacillus sp. NEAU-GSW1]MUT65760.1 DJ-1/PfpI family protein [Paenibacillus sp. NEAU-GSW1]
MQKQRRVGILLFDHVDVLDYSGPFEVFSLTVNDPADVPKMLLNRISKEEKPFIVYTLSQYGQQITAHNGLKIQPDYSLNDHPEFDIVIIPGGPLTAVKSGISNPELLQWIAEQHRSNKWVASICSGAILLAEAGLLTNRRATTNWFVLDYLENNYPEVEVLRNVRYVDSGDVMTSAGVSAGIDMALYMVGKLLGQDAAQTTAHTIEYPYLDAAKA